jgi:hypothetical protein
MQLSADYWVLCYSNAHYHIVKSFNFHQNNLYKDMANNLVFVSVKITVMRNFAINHFCLQHEIIVLNYFTTFLTAI